VLPLVGTAFFPFFCFTMAAYDGTLLALGLATALLPTLALYLRVR
jgi:hypothetical protein